MKNRRPINEDDIYLTEMLVARSYGNLKQSVARTTSETLSSLGGTVGGTIKRHPYAAAGAAAGAGIILFGLFKLMHRNGSSRGQPAAGRGSVPGLDLFSLLMPILTPYITAYLEKNLGQIFSKNRDRKA